MVEFSVWDIFRNLLLAARWTVVLSLIAFIGGGIVGGLLLVLRLSKMRFADRFVGGYVQLFQGTPLLMQLFLAYFGLALFGFKTSAWVSAVTGAMAWASTLRLTSAAKATGSPVCQSMRAASAARSVPVERRLLTRAATSTGSGKGSVERGKSSQRG